MLASFTTLALTKGQSWSSYGLAPSPLSLRLGLSLSPHGACAKIGGYIAAPIHQLLSLIKPYELSALLALATAQLAPL